MPFLFFFFPCRNLSVTGFPRYSCYTGLKVSFLPVTNGRVRVPCLRVSFVAYRLCLGVPGPSACHDPKYMVSLYFTSSQGSVITVGDLCRPLSLAPKPYAACPRPVCIHTSFSTIARAITAIIRPALITTVTFCLVCHALLLPCVSKPRIADRRLLPISNLSTSS